MNQLQSAAHTDGFKLVADAFNSRQKFNIDAAVGWLNHHAANDGAEESIQLLGRDADGNMTRVTKIVATRSELSGYRIAGIFAALEGIRDKLEKSGVTLRLATNITEKRE